MLLASLTNQNLPMPAGGMLFSPWVSLASRPIHTDGRSKYAHGSLFVVQCDLADTNTSQSWVENAEIDYVPAVRLHNWMRLSLLQILCHVLHILWRLCTQDLAATGVRRT